MTIHPDTTLGEVKHKIYHTREYDDLLGMTVSPYTLQIRFLTLPSREEYEDSTRWEEFRQMLECGAAIIEISDRSGGTPVQTPEPELG